MAGMGKLRVRPVGGAAAQNWALLAAPLLLPRCCCLCVAKGPNLRPLAGVCSFIALCTKASVTPAHEASRRPAQVRLQCAAALGSGHQLAVEVQVVVSLLDRVQPCQVATAALLDCAVRPAQPKRAALGRNGGKVRLVVAERAAPGIKGMGVS